MNELNTILGGSILNITKLDGGKEDVKVLQLPIKKYPAYLAVIEEEDKMIELLCDKPSGFSETLMPESWEAVIVLGETLNSDFFWRWVQRRRTRQENFTPGLTEKLIAVLASKDLSPKPPSVPALPSRKPAATA